LCGCGAAPQHGLGRPVETRLVVFGGPGWVRVLPLEKVIKIIRKGGQPSPVLMEDLQIFRARAGPAAMLKTWRLRNFAQA